MSKSNKLFFSALAILVTVGLGVLTNQKSNPAYSDRPLYAALLVYISDPYWKTIEEGLKETADDLGLMLHVQGIMNASDAEGQLNQCEATLLKNPKAIIFAAADSVNLASCLKKANERGIVLVDIDGNINQKRTKEMGVDVSFSVASNNYEIGKKAAQYLDGKSGKVLVLEGLDSSYTGKGRIKGFRENIKRDLKIVASQPGDWDRLKAADVVRRIIVQHPDLSFIFAANDAMALGAVESLRSADIHSVIVIGVDGTANAVKSIKAGELTASIAQLPYLMAKEALEKAKNQVEHGKTIDFHQDVPIVVLDRAVFEKGSEPLLRYLR